LGYEGFIRVSYCADPQKIAEAMGRMKQAVAKMKK